MKIKLNNYNIVCYINLVLLSKWYYGNIKTRYFFRNFDYSIREEVLNIILEKIYRK